jgi:hypothetical protein
MTWWKLTIAAILAIASLICFGLGILALSDMEGRGGITSLKLFGAALAMAGIAVTIGVR